MNGAILNLPNLVHSGANKVNLIVINVKVLGALETILSKMKKNKKIL